MSAPTTPYKVYSKNYSISGDVRSGYRASVSYFMEWQYAFRFADDIFGRTSAVTQGPITWQLPYRFPVTVAPLYAQRFNIEPMGLDNHGNPITVTNKGLAPGEYWTHALVHVEFETPSAIQQQQDDRGNQNQFDPDNPITVCEQSIKIAGKMVHHQGDSLYFADGKAVPGEYAIPWTESRLVLTFPRVPYLPWKLIRPYINTVNDVAILGCDRGTLLLSGMDTKVTVTNFGYGQSLQLEFSDNGTGRDWNTAPRNGTYVLVHIKDQPNTDANRLYKYTDFRQIFASITFV